MSATVETTNVWGRILHSLKGRLNQQTLETWFSPIRFESLDSSQHVLRLRAQNQHVKVWIVSNYGKVLAESLNEQRLSGYSVGWVVGKVSDWVPTEISLPSLDSVTAETEETASVTGEASPAITVTENSALAEPSLSAQYTYDSFV